MLCVFATSTLFFDDCKRKVYADEVTDQAQEIVAIMENANEVSNTKKKEEQTSSADDSDATKQKLEENVEQNVGEEQAGIATDKGTVVDEKNESTTDEANVEDESQDDSTSSPLKKDKHTQFVEPIKKNDTKKLPISSKMKSVLLNATAAISLAGLARGIFERKKINKILSSDMSFGKKCYAALKGMLFNKFPQMDATADKKFKEDEENAILSTLSIDTDPLQYTESYDEACVRAYLPDGEVCQDVCGTCVLKEHAIRPLLPPCRPLNATLDVCKINPLDLDSQSTEVVVLPKEEQKANECSAYTEKEAREIYNKLLKSDFHRKHGFETPSFEEFRARIKGNIKQDKNGQWICGTCPCTEFDSDFSACRLFGRCADQGQGEHFIRHLAGADNCKAALTIKRGDKADNPVVFDPKKLAKKMNISESAALDYKSECMFLGYRRWVESRYRELEKNNKINLDTYAEDCEEDPYSGCKGKTSKDDVKMFTAAKKTRDACNLPLIFAGDNNSKKIKEIWHHDLKGLSQKDMDVSIDLFLKMYYTRNDKNGKWYSKPAGEYRCFAENRTCFSQDDTSWIRVGDLTPEVLSRNWPFSTPQDFLVERGKRIRMYGSIDNPQ